MTRPWFTGWLLVGALVACDGDDEVAGRVPTVSTVSVTPDSVFLFNAGLQQAVRLTPNGQTLAQVHLELPGVVVDDLPLSGGAHAVLTQASPALLVVAPDGMVTEIELPSPYTAMSLDPEGRWLVTWFRPGETAVTDDVFLNVNQVSFVDLQNLASEVRTVVLQGSQPSRVDFVPDFTLAANALSLVVASGEGTMVFVDPLSADPANQQRVVRLTPPESLSEPVPSAVRCAARQLDGESRMLCTAIIRGFNEVFVIELLEGDTETGWTFQPTINLVNVPENVEAAFDFDTTDGARMLVLTATRAVRVVNPQSRSSVSVPLAQFRNGALLFDTVEDGEVERQAVLYRSGDPIVEFAELGRLEVEGDGAVTARRLRAPVESIRPLAGSTDLALITYSSGAGVGILQLSRRSEVSLTVQPGLVIAGITTLNSQVFARLNGDERLAIVDAATGLTSQLELERVPVQVAVLPGSGQLMVQYQSEYLAFYNPASIADGPYAYVNGLFFDGLFDRGQ